jgi:hypothetical protein
MNCLRDAKAKMAALKAEVATLKARFESTGLTAAERKRVSKIGDEIAYVKKAAKQYRKEAALREELDKIGQGMTDDFYDTHGVKARTGDAVGFERDELKAMHEAALKRHSCRPPESNGQMRTTHVAHQASRLRMLRWV